MRVITPVLGPASHLRVPGLWTLIRSSKIYLYYLDAPPVLIAGATSAGLTRAATLVEAFGLRVADTVMLADAEARLERQGAASAIWIELDGGPADQIDGLLRRLNADVRGGRYRGVVSAPIELIDPLSAVLDDDVQLIIGADDAERASALAVALAARGTEQRYSDIASDQNAERLRQLSDEVSRIASTLARLSTGPSAAPPAIEAAASAATRRQVSAETVRSVIRARRLRARYFPEELFADPAWDMLLDLFQAEIAQLRVPVSSLCIAAAVPATTALRWLKTMVSEGCSSAAPIRMMAAAYSSSSRRRRARAAPLFRRGGPGRGRLSRLRPPRRVARRFGRLAQLVEHLVYTERVGGSNPSAPTMPWSAACAAHASPRIGEHCGRSISIHSARSQPPRRRRAGNGIRGYRDAPRELSVQSQTTGAITWRRRRRAKAGRRATARAARRPAVKAVARQFGRAGVVRRQWALER